ncbi:haloacid dehalogenase superfamily, subfamily IA, variant 3 with third motif having DD or ED [Pedobacter terrae]|uniref:Haloacid dehalogenase superfamily, subfamily IA, variant 3 with third motif having DD or ED n=1 Tax=Pedobacter terrae TaxID=405671 RepID=A0A1G7NT90_9SPHI|nr:HAD family phosphatase [Pedobacter terrae]SDF77275.1 haloacid dehalogenase superfamily, subfamily IA, variant 3 with third motif having DD or ED [Pedobacter terrae]
MRDLNFSPKAFLFDLNGTMIDDMEYHTLAWYGIMTEDLGADLDYASVKKEMYGKNHEVLERVFGKDKFSPEEIERLSVDKEKRYQAGYLPHLSLIAGLDNFLERSKAAKIPMAIGSAAIPFNIDFVVDGLNIRHYLEAIVSADDVQLSKPDPETFLNAAAALGVAPADCLVFEDAPKGVESALNAGMQCLVLTTTHTLKEFDGYPNILGYINDYNDTKLNLLF